MKLRRTRRDSPSLLLPFLHLSSAHRSLLPNWSTTGCATAYPQQSVATTISIASSRGYVPFGDAICAFNPICGEGMTVAALEALTLRECLLADIRAVTGPFFRSIGPALGARLGYGL